MSISCDTDKAAWEKYMKEEQLGGLQLWMGKGKDMKDLYGIQTISPLYPVRPERKYRGRLDDASFR